MVMQYRPNRCSLLYALFQIAVLALGAGSQGAFATEPTGSGLQSEKRELDKKIRELGQQVAAENEKIEAIETGEIDSDWASYPEFGGYCKGTCEPGKGSCSEQDFTK